MELYDASVSNNINNHNNNYNRCKIQEHNNKKLDLICFSCNEKKICLSCSLGQHKNHDVREIKIEFEINVLPFLDIYTKCNNVVTSKSSQLNQIINDEYEMNKELITDHYEKIIAKIRNEQSANLELLDKYQNDHRKYYQNHISILNQENEELTSVLNDSELINDLSSQTISENYYKSKDVILKGVNSNVNLLSKFKRINVNFDKFNKCIINEIPFENMMYPSEDSVVDSTWLENCLYINKNNFKIPISNLKKYKSIALGPDVDIKLLSIPNNIEHVLFLDGYNMELVNGSIKNNANYSLHFFNIKSNLTKDFIPKSITTLYLHDGFSQNLESFINENIEVLHFYNIDCNLNFKSMPSGVKSVHFHDGFDQILNAGILKNSVQNLHFYKISENSIKLGAIPSTVGYICFHDGFNQELEPNIIPEGIKILEFNNVLKPLKLGSIPNSVYSVFFNSGFNHEIGKGVLRQGIQTLHFKNNQYPLNQSSIPSSVNLIEFGDVKNNLVVGSVPNSVTTIILLDGFSTQLVKGILPNNQNLELKVGDIKYPFTKGSIPDSVKTIELINYGHFLEPEILPNGMSELSLKNLKKPLFKGSIPKSVKSLIISEMDGLFLEKGILNEGLKLIKFINMSSIILNKDSIPRSVETIIAPKSFQNSLSFLKNINISYT